MAGLTPLRKAAVVRISVAIGTLVEWNSCVSWFVVRSRRVAPGTRNLRVQSGQRIACLAVIELPDVDRLPVFEVVARLASLAQTPVVRVLVAGGTGGRQAEISTAEVFDLNGRAFCGWNSCRRVATIATQPRMLAFENVSRLFVIEGLDVPLDEREVFAVVLGMAACALLARAWRDVVGCVQSFASDETACDLGMAVQALQSGLSAKLVASGAVRGSV